MATTIKLQRLHPTAIKPLHTQGFDVSNATDLFTHSQVEVRPGETWMVPTGWAVAELPESNRVGGFGSTGR